MAGPPTHPAAYMFTKVTLPAVWPFPPALLNSPAVCPVSAVFQGCAFACWNSCKNLLCSSPSQRSLPYTDH